MGMVRPVASLHSSWPRAGYLFSVSLRGGVAQHLQGPSDIQRVGVSGRVGWKASVYVTRTRWVNRCVYGGCTSLRPLPPPLPRPFLSALARRWQPANMVSCCPLLPLPISPSPPTILLPYFCSPLSSQHLPVFSAPPVTLLNLSATPLTQPTLPSRLLSPVVSHRNVWEQRYLSSHRTATTPVCPQVNCRYATDR